MFSIKDLDVALADIKNTNITYMAVKDLLFWPTGGSQAPRLPVAYQEVEYIQADGNQYIDTGYAPNNNTKIYAKFAHGAPQNNGPLFGARGRSGYTEYNYQYILRSHCSEYNQGGTATDNKPCPLFCHEYSTSSTSGGIKFLETRYPAGTVIEFEYDKTGGYYGPDNTWTWSPATSTANINMLIFGLREGTTIDSRKFDGKLFAFKVWESGTLKRDFVPCFRKEDGEIGLYDLVYNEFYNNKGSGTFTMGGDTRKSILPRGYSEIQYIQSTATNPGTITSSGQYIDTLYTPNQYTKIAIDMQFQNLTRQSRLFAIHDTNTSYMTMAAYINGSDKWARAMKNGEGDWLSTEVAVDTNRHTFTLKNGNYKVQTGNTVNYNSSNATSSSTSARHTLPLLAAWDFVENKIVDHSSAKIYGCTIFEKDVMVRNFMPCVSKYGEIGLYDFVEGKFYPNVGTGEFIPGPRVYYEDFVNIPKDGLLGYWPLSSDLKDYSGNRKDGRRYSGTGAFSKIASKDGARVTTNNPVSTQHIITALNYCEAPITVGGWVCYNAMNSNAWHGMISNSSASGNGCTIGSRPADNNYPSAVIASGTVVRIDSVVPSTNRWYFWMATNDGTTLKTYQNGVLTNSGPVSSFTNGGVWKLGCAMVDGGQTVNSGTDGWVRHCFVYNRVLNGDEAMDVYKKTSFSERGKSDLTFCDYIESTGTQWIDTGLTGAQADDVEMEFSFPNQPSAVAIPMGVRGENSVADSVIRINESNIIEPRFGSGINTGVEMLAKTKYKVRTTFASGSQTVYVNDVQKATGTLTYTYNASRTYYLFAFHDTSEVNFKCSCRMYSCKIKLGGTVVRNFVPCFVKYTGEAGMWDTVNEKFYPNIGTGSFGKGFNKFNPEDYQKVEYIETTGTQCINTQLFAKNDMQIEVKIQANSTLYESIPIFGSVLTSSGDGSSLGSWYHLTPHNYKFYYGLNNGEGNAGTYNNQVGQQYEIVFNNSDKQIVINGSSIATIGTTQGYSGSTLNISRRGTSGSYRYGSFRYFYFKIYDKAEGKYLRNFVPCYRIRDGVIGLYDTVNDYFYTNVGSGSFAKGRNIYEKKDLAFCGYIQSTGTQYIKTNIVPSNTKGVYLKVSSQDVLTDLLYFGSRKGTDTRFWIGNSQNNNNGQIYLGWNTNDRSSNISTNTIYEIKLNYLNDRKKQVNDTVITSSIGTLSSSNDVPVYIFAGNDNYSTDSSKYAPSKIRMYSCKVSDGSNIIADFKPCYIKKTGEAGLWDEVEQKFYGNDGTGAFYRGNNGAVPSLYQKVEYIQSSGTQYINTLYKPNQDTKVEMKAMITSDTSNCCFFIGRTGASDKSFGVFKVDGKFRHDYNSAQQTVNMTVATNTQYTIVADKNILYINGTSVDTRTVGTFQAGYVMLLFASNLGGDSTSLGNYLTGRLFYTKVREDGTLIRDFVPCYRKTDSVIGLYDLVNEVFYTNAGSGSFTKGADV